MLIDKLDSNIQDPVISPRALYKEKQHSATNLTRFPVISSHSSHHSHLPILCVSTPKHGRGGILQTPTHMPSPIPDEINSGRGPKIYNKNLPDVFIPTTPAGKRIK